MPTSVLKHIVCLAVLLTFWVAPVSAQTVGQVVNVTPGASFLRDGGRVAVTPGAEVERGDILVTNRSGLVEVIFNDDTKLAVGSGSRLIVADVLISGSNRAEKFTLRAISGTFRFLSGSSRKEVYDIRTPSATLGIRGTEFDFTVVTRTLTDLVTFGGTVFMCNESGSCASVSGRCSVGQAPSFSDVRAPENRAERDAILSTDFPFAIDQSPLSQPFRLTIASCGAIAPIPAGYEPFREDPNAGPPPVTNDSPPRKEQYREDDGPILEDDPCGQFDC